VVDGVSMCPIEEVNSFKYLGTEIKQQTKMGQQWHRVQKIPQNTTTNYQF